ncbi:MAG: transposase [Pseudomonadota bacterium]
MVDSAAHLVDEVLPKRPIRQWVLSVPYPLRYLFATNPKVMSQVLTIVHRIISTFLIKRARMTIKSGAQGGAVTLIQRFGSALNLNTHFHMLYLNGIYEANGYFWPVKPPSCEDLDVIAHTIARRVSRFLEKAGYLVRDRKAAPRVRVPGSDAGRGRCDGCYCRCVYYLSPGIRTPCGAGRPRRKALTLQTVPVRTKSRKGNDLVSKQAGFSLHAGIACK